MLKSEKTAISRKELPVPVRKAKNFIAGRILDYGCGRGSVGRILGPRVTSYDPYYAPEKPSGRFDTVLLIYVLNVLTWPDRKKVLNDIKKYMAPGSTLVIGVRTKSELDGLGKRGWTRLQDGWVTQKGTFQHGFTQSEIIDLVTDSGFSLIKEIDKNTTVYKLGGKMPNLRKNNLTAVRGESGNAPSGAASALYKSFHENPPANTRKLQMNPPKPGETLIAIGKLARIDYLPYGSSAHKNIQFYHKSGDTGSKMVKNNIILATNADGSELYLIKENPNSPYPKFTNRGIIG